MTVTQAKSAGTVFDGTEEPLVDNYGNEIIVPKGFKVIEGTNATDGIVIQDESAKDNISKGNQFVWIPVGDVYTTADETKTSENTKTIELDRYHFEVDPGNVDGVKRKISEETDGYGAFLKSNFTESTTARINEAGKNATAKNISGFLAEATKGFYIGRYEARVQGYTNVATSNSENKENWTGYTGGTLVSKKDAQVYNYITQNKAAELSRAMYSSLGKFESDLINSYAWDTATLFLQEFGEKNYSIKSSVNSSLANKGTSDSDYNGTRDVVCNVYDMASNCYEWTTETYSISGPCVHRGGFYNYGWEYTSNRHYGIPTSTALNSLSFRTILYAN